jgi:hypothetical protein
MHENAPKESIGDQDVGSFPCSFLVIGVFVKIVTVHLLKKRIQ